MTLIHDFFFFFFANIFFLSRMVVEDQKLKYITIRHLKLINYFFFVLRASTIYSHFNHLKSIGPPI